MTQFGIISVNLFSVQNMVVINRKSNLSFPTAGAWKTCLRQIAIATDADYIDQLKEHLDQDDQVFQNEAGLQFLIEVLCGLHSPVFAETEVFGQFKIFLNELPETHYFKTNPDVLPFILGAVKKVRSEYLRDCGGKSYGHVLRQRLQKSGRVTLWGYGQLGQEIFPWIKNKCPQVVVRQQRQDEAIPFTTEIVDYTGDHLIAAPISDIEMKKLLSQCDGMVFDLRGKSIIRHERVVPLSTVMEEIEKHRNHQRELLPLCQALTEKLIQDFQSQSTHRPFGWDDLCG
jgi:glutamyl-tRNA reductase